MACRRHPCLFSRVLRAGTGSPAIGILGDAKRSDKIFSELPHAVRLLPTALVPVPAALPGRGAGWPGLRPVGPSSDGGTMCRRVFRSPRPSPARRPLPTVHQLVHSPPTRRTAPEPGRPARPSPPPGHPPPTARPSTGRWTASKERQHDPTKEGHRAAAGSLYRRRGRGGGRVVDDPLVHSAADGSMAPGVAETWSVEGGTARFTLREGVTCEDGAPLTASDVAAEYNHIADPANKSPLRPSLLSHRWQPRESHTRHPWVSQTPRTARSTRSRR
ncbi:ABC transporter substrate-binding protein [Kitasatospora sp. NPDC092286]|uniref:ABC transporter substrate-binding protein n=1 Tax=Kitasatospora sp. NPDC092286 TaxID=3364087 RepID=UPI003820D1D0